MDSFDDQILEYGKSATDIFQVARTKKRTAFDKVMDMILNNFITLLDGLSGDEHLFVLCYPDRIELLEVQSELRMTSFDLSGVVTDSSNFEEFEYDGFLYKKRRRLK
jgi:hypothetical protein